MKSICIKTNNLDYLDYLLNDLKYFDMDNVCFSQNEFKNYKNVIIHYKGIDNNLFLSKICQILSCLVIDEAEENLLKNIIIRNYFYFDSVERKKILDICFELIEENFTEYFDKKYSILYDDFFNFLSDNKCIIFSGFINFRIKDYILVLEEIADEAVNSFILEKEYLEFVSLLKLYINSQKSNCDIVHLIYSSEHSILLNKDKSIINISEEVFRAKFLSDISFSSNDYALNALLTLLPKKIYIHLIDMCIDEFINTLQLVFENRIEICTDCNICKIYKNNKDINKSFN